MRKVGTMRIAWFHGNMLHTNSGGTRFVVDYAAGLKNQHGHEVTVFCDCASDEILSQFKELDIPVVKMDRFSTNHPVYWLTLPVRIWNKQTRYKYINDEYDCIVCSLFPMNLLAASFSIPKVQMCYEPFAFFYDKGFMQNYTWAERLFFKVMSMLYSRWDKIAVRGMNRVLTVNKTNLPKLRSIYGVDAVPVYAGIDPRIYTRASDEAIRIVRDQHPGYPLLFHSTDLTGIKGTYPLLDLIKKLSVKYPDIKLLVTIYVDLPVSIQRFKSRVSELDLEQHVEYLGCLPKDRLPLYYSAVDFICQPSINQPANWPLKEAQLCGTPIIGGIESEEVNGKNGAKIDVRNVDESASVLLQLFAQDRSSFVLDVEELTRLYSIDSCLSRFNEIVTTA